MVKMAKSFLIFGVALVATVFVAAEAENEQGPSSLRNEKIVRRWIEQKLDHFNNNDTRTWVMQYVTNGELYEPGGPLFIVVGGMGSIWENRFSITNGLLYDIAREHKALLLLTEHRFYGNSQPTGDLTVENLKFLTTEQALADLAHFIRSIKSLPGMNNASVILAGDNYSGAMVTWFKKLYPDLAAGCWALSPRFFAKLDFKEFKEAIGQSIRLVGGDNCYNRIGNGIKEIEKMCAENRTAELKRAFNLCDSFDANNKLDVATLLSFIFDVIGMPAVYHNYENQNINYICDELMSVSNDFNSLSQFVRLQKNSNCNDVSYKNVMANAKETTIGITSVTTITLKSLPNDILNHLKAKLPMRMIYFMCQDIFGKTFTPKYMKSQINKTNKLYGKLSQDVENVYMIYGQLDPWLSVGIQDVTKATILPMTSNIPYLDSISDEDDKELKAAKIKFKNFVEDWLKPHKKQH